MGRSRNTLTPMIGLSLAALVAGSLVTLAVLAQRVTLEGPVAQRIVPRRANQSTPAAPLIVAGDQPVSGSDTEQEPNGPPEPPEDRVLPLRVRREPQRQPQKPNRDRSGPRRREEPAKPDDHPGRGRGTGPNIPPGLAKKRDDNVQGGGGKHPAPSRKARPSRPQPKGHGSCGSPPCGNAYGHQQGNGHQKARGAGHHKGHHKHK